MVGLLTVVVPDGDRTFGGANLHMSATAHSDPVTLFGSDLNSYENAQVGMFVNFDMWGDYAGYGGVGAGPNGTGRSPT